MKRTRLLLAILIVAVVALLVGCAPGDPRYTAETPAGFWTGLWHGAIAVFTLVIGIFSDSVHMYEVNNTGGWYDFGFFVAVTAIWGGGSHAYHRNARRRMRDKEWEEIGRKVEHKLKRKIREWAEAEPDDDWEVVGELAEEKLKRNVREWAEAP